eukprot:TRINITY_DN7203_c0_g1_i6.p1 TRINITY_DN7203_c0_g1~~TRINITY_DN7203_c0_g1_i6.p1  ORF type:complete len:718 (+),score=141.29 TRINITY_DN7203_c0_g1_i6:1317-3470(+)
MDIRSIEGKVDLSSSGLLVDYQLDFTLFSYTFQGSARIQIGWDAILQWFLNQAKEGLKSIFGSIISMKRNLAQIDSGQPVSTTGEIAVWHQTLEEACTNWFLDSTFKDYATIVLAARDDDDPTHNHTQILPACVLQMKGISGVIARDWLHGSFPDLPEVNTDLKLLRLSENPLLVGTLPSSIKNLASLESLYLRDLGMTGDISDLSQLTKLRVLDLSGTHFSLGMGGGPITTAFQLVASMPLLEQYQFGSSFRYPLLMGTDHPSGSGNRSSSVLDVEGLYITYAAVRVRRSLDFFCSDCSPSQRMWSCHLLASANKTAFAGFKQSVMSYLLNSGISSDGTVEITRIQGYCVSSSVISFKYTNVNENALDVVKLLDKWEESQFVDPDYPIANSKAQNGCLPGRVGLTCRYFCQNGWSSQDQTLYPGGVITRSSKSMTVHQRLLTMLPRCSPLTDCGGNCTALLNVVREHCGSWLYSFDPQDELLCRGALERAANTCNNSATSDNNENSFYCYVTTVTGFADLLPPLVTKYPVNLLNETDDYSYLQLQLLVERHLDQDSYFTTNNFPAIESDRIKLYFLSLHPDIAAVDIPDIRDAPLMSTTKRSGSQGVLVTVRLSIPQDSAKTVSDFFDVHVNSSSLAEATNLKMALMDVVKIGNYEGLTVVTDVPVQYTTHDSHVLAIVLGVVLGTAFVALVVLLAIFFLRRRTTDEGTLETYYSL